MSTKMIIFEGIWLSKRRTLVMDSKDVNLQFLSAADLL